MQTIQLLTPDLQIQKEQAFAYAQLKMSAEDASVSRINLNHI